GLRPASARLEAGRELAQSAGVRGGPAALSDPQEPAAGTVPAGTQLGPLLADVDARQRLRLGTVLLTIQRAGQDVALLGEIAGELAELLVRITGDVRGEHGRVA